MGYPEEKIENQCALIRAGSPVQDKIRVSISCKSSRKTLKLNIIQLMIDQGMLRFSLLKVKENALT